MRWQQFTGPVMAKGLEDTAFYAHHCLISRNEEGGDPLREGPPYSLADFHGILKDQSEHWPYAMNATSTHDTKRSEDVRARINVLSELPDEGRARRALDQGYRVAATVDDEPGLAPTLHQLGLLYRQQGGWDRALELFHRALALQTEAKDQAGMAMTLGSIAEVLHGRGDLRKALETYCAPPPARYWSARASWRRC